MRTPHFNEEGTDESTFAPFTIEDCREGDQPDVRLAFYDFETIEEAIGIPPEDYQLNGNEMGEIMISIIDDNGLIQHPEGTYDGGYFDNCEGDTCYFHFNHLDDAVRVAEFCLELFKDKQRLAALLSTHDISAGNDDHSNADSSPSVSTSDTMAGITKLPSHPDAITYEEAVSMRDRMRRL